jgi:uncharacterized protein (UPF0332 family)
MRGDKAQFGSLLGKFPAKNCVKVTETLLELFAEQRLPVEDFNSFVSRVGVEKLKEMLEPLRQTPSFAADPSFYEDYGHQHEQFAIRKGIKGECAGSTVAEKVPTIEEAKGWLAQAEALIYHREYETALLAAYEAAAAAARVPLYQRLVDPFTADETLWEFENLFVLSGETQDAWQNVSSYFQELKNSFADEVTARKMQTTAREFVDYCARAQFLERAYKIGTMSVAAPTSPLSTTRE